MPSRSQSSPRRSARRRQEPGRTTAAREPRGILTHLLALAQTLLVAQVGIGLLLLSEPSSGGRPPPLPVRDAVAARGARAVDVRADRAPRPSRVVHRRYLGGRSARGAGVLDGNMSRFSAHQPVPARDADPRGDRRRDRRPQPRTARCSRWYILARVALHPRDRVLHLPHVARSSGGDLDVAARARGGSSTARRSWRSRTSASTGTAARSATRCSRSSPSSCSAGSRCGARGATSTRTSRAQASTRAEVPSSAASASRTGT